MINGQRLEIGNSQKEPKCRLTIQKDVSNSLRGRNVNLQLQDNYHNLSDWQNN